MKNEIYLKVWGDFACFTSFARNERVSYPAMTPSAARGILETILYKKEFRWSIDRIAVKNPIKYFVYKTNEVRSIIKENSYYNNAVEDRTQCVNLILKNVCYVIHASVVEKTNNPINNFIKYISMFNRRMDRGEKFRSPYFGMRQFMLSSELTTEKDMETNPNPNADQHFGCILFDRFDLDKRDEGVQKTTVFEASLKNGIMEIPKWETIKQLNSKLFTE